MSTHGDVWDLTDQDGGDHVLVALTIEECHSIVEALDKIDTRSALSAQREISNTIRDQKDIEV